MQVDVPDIGLVDFPDDMTDEQITSAIEEHLRSPGAARTATIPQITLSPYEKADIASMEAGMGKAYQGPFQGGGLFGGTEEQRREILPILSIPGGVVKQITPKPVEQALTYTGNVLAAIPADIAQTVAGEQKYYDMLNLGAAALGEPMPIRQKLSEAAMEDSGLLSAATLGKVSMSAPELALLMRSFGFLPKVAQELGLMGFTAQQLMAVPEEARLLGQELGKPEGQRDPNLINDLKISIAENAAFGVAGGVGLKRSVQRGYQQAISAPFETRTGPVIPDIVRAGPFSWGAEPLPLPRAPLGIPMSPAGTTEQERITDYASQITKDAAVYGDVRPQPREGPGPVPAEGGRPGVRPQAEVLAEEAQVLLTPEQRYLAAEREAIDVGEQMGMKVEFADQEAPGQPFSKGRLMVPTAEGARINRAEYARFMNMTRSWTPEQRLNALRSRLNEESIHRPLVEDPRGHGIAEAFWSGMTAAEKAINYYRYTGHRSAEAMRKAGIEPFEDWQMGMEAMRFQMQRLKGMEPTEIANEIGAGKLGMRAITLLEDAIRFMRESFGTRASQMQRDLMRAYESKIDLAKQLASMPKGRAPASYLKGTEADAKGKEMADALGMRLDGVREVPNRGAFFTFTLFDRAGKESSTITLPSDATLADVRAKYEAKIADYGDVPDAPRPPASGAPIKPEVAVRAPETPGKALNKLGDPMGTTYRGTPEDVAAYKAASARMAQRGPDMMDAWGEAERIKNKYGGMPPAEPSKAPASMLKYGDWERMERIGPLDELRPVIRVGNMKFRADTMAGGHEQAMSKALQFTKALPREKSQELWRDSEMGFENAAGDWYNRDEVHQVFGAYTSERLSREPASYLKRKSAAGLDDEGRQFFSYRLFAAQHGETAHNVLGNMIESGLFEHDPGLKEMARALHELGDKGTKFSNNPKSGPQLENVPYYDYGEGGDVLYMPKIEDMAEPQERGLDKYLDRYDPENLVASDADLGAIYLHEYSHSLTSKYLEKPSQERRYLLSIMDDVRKWSNENQVTDLARDRDPYEIMDDVEYALSGPEEFTSMVFDRQWFQELLKKIPARDVYKGRSVISNVFDKVVRTIGRILGFGDDTALSDVLKLVLGIGSKMPSVEARQRELLPASYLKKKKGPQPEFFMPEVAGKAPERGIPVQKQLIPPPGVPREERITAEQAGAFVPKATELEAAAMANLSILDNVPLGEVGKADRPGFKPFMQRIKDSYGDIQPGQMVSLWEDAVWKKLVNASGETLAKLRKSLKLESRYGTRELSESVKPPDIQPEFGALVKGFPYKKPRGGAWAKQMNTPAAKYRATVISAIARKLIGEAAESAPKVTRESIDAGDIAFWKETTEGPFHTITKAERRVPAWLERVLTEGARVGPMINATISNRVAVLLDRTTGNVEIVTVYKDPKSKTVMAVNPLTAHAIRPSVPISTLMRRYQPIYSVLLDSPLKGFHQHFTTLAEFNEAIGHEANRIAQGRTRQEMTAGGAFQGGEQPEEPPTRQQLLGEEAKQFVPGRIAIPGIFQIGRGQVELSRRIPLTAPEARAVIDHVYDEVGKVDSPMDMVDALEGLKASAAQNLLRGRDRLVISAFQKAADRILKENTPPERKGQPPPEPTITPDQAWEQALNEYYQILQNHGETADQFAQTALSRFGERPPSTVGIPELGPVPGSVRPATGARELAMRSRVPSTVTRPEQLPPGYVPPTKELPPVMTEADPGAVRSPEVLDREGLQWVESLAERGLRERATEIGGRPVVSEILKPTGKVKFYPRPAPASYLKSKSRLTEEVGKVGASLGALVTRRGVKADIYRTLDGAESAANEYALKAGQSIRVISKNPMVRAAARAVIASGETTDKGWSPNPKNLDNFIVQIHNAQYRANNLLASKDWRDRFVGRKWLNAANRLQAEVEYAQQHWMDPELQDTALATRRELREEIEFEKANGSTINEIENYLPGMYEGEIFNDNAITFGALRTLGKNFRLPKTFKNYYDAIEAGPYIPSSYDVSNIAQSRIVRGRYSVEKRLWAESLKGMNDPQTGERVAVDPTPVIQVRPVMDPISGEVINARVVERWKSPSKTRELVYTTKGAKPIAVLRGYEGAVQTATMESPVSKTPLGRAGLLSSGLLKHGVVLIYDTFHPGRLFQYGAAIGGRNWRTSAIGYRGGYSALNYRAEDLPLAVQQGLITQGAADWALGTVEVQTRRGPLKMTRQQLASEFIRQGLNASKITDALYKDAVSRVPGIGGTWHKIISPINKWVFDRMTPGLMVEGAVRNFERLNAKHPDIPVNRLMKDVITDINATFGNMRRQGIFKNPMWRDIAQIFLLAPMWREGLYQKELRAYSRVLRYPLRLAGQVTGQAWLKTAGGRQGLPAFGTLGRGMARGLLAYLVLAQVLNLISRQKLTFQNEEEGHKLDAWIPTGSGEGDGFWLPTMGVFAEVLHDFIRLGETKPKVWDAIVQIGENMLGPLGKFEHVLTRGETPMGRKLTSTGAVIGAAAQELAPTPISLGTPVRYLASKVAPGTIAPPPPGALPQRALGAGGIKVTRAETPVQMIMQKAVRFMEENNLQRSTGYEWVTTDEPSYSKLRSAIRYKDWRAARNMLDALRKRLGDGADRRIVDDMQKYSRRPITGSDKTEQLFKNSLSDADLDLYSRATFQKGQEYNDFLEWFYSQPPQE